MPTKKQPVFTQIQLTFIETAIKTYERDIQDSEFRDGSILTKGFVLQELKDIQEKLVAHFTER